MRLHILYRLWAGENTAVGRPFWYTKHGCYKSLVRQLIGDSTFTVLLDGIAPLWLRPATSHEPWRDVIHLEKHGKDESFMACFSRAVLYDEQDWVYFVEDDYFHQMGAIAKLLACIEDVKPDLISLYDHPDRYKDLPEHNLTQGKNDIFVSRDHHWRTIPSTCMTFACSVRVLRGERGLFEEWKHVDFELFPRLLGLKGDRPKKYLMVGAMPSLATHCQEGYLAPTINWEGQWTLYTL